MVFYGDITTYFYGRKTRGNEEREKREDEKGSHCFFKSSGCDKLELKPQSMGFFSSL